MSAENATTRFSDRAGDYDRFRPTYPWQVLTVARDELGLAGDWAIADIGSGTGILSRLFLENGNTVFGVEPNQQMAKYAVRNLGEFEQFLDVRGTAESTGLSDDSVELVVAAQAFHWFDAVQAGNEFRRILREPKAAMVIWNSRSLDATPFLSDYESFLLEWGTDYESVSHNHRNEDASLDALFGPGQYRHVALSNEQLLDLNGLTGRIVSCSYVPNREDAKFPGMLEAIHQLFKTHQENGVVRMKYNTDIYLGVLN